MYLPAHFAASTADAYDLIRQHPLGALVHQHAGGLDANHLPWELETPEAAPARLIGHVARANPLLEQLHDGVDVLVIFQAEQAYISPNWYPSKHETHRQVPTWNYQAVHAHGTITIHDDERFVRGVVARLTRRHEARQPAPWKMGDAPVDYIDAQVRAIVGVEIAITALTGKMKLSQNRATRDRLSAADALDEQGSSELAQAMRQAI